MSHHSTIDQLKSRLRKIYTIFDSAWAAISTKARKKGTGFRENPCQKSRIAASSEMTIQVSVFSLEGNAGLNYVQVRNLKGCSEVNAYLSVQHDSIVPGFTFFSKTGYLLPQPRAHSFCHLPKRCSPPAFLLQFLALPCHPTMLSFHLHAQTCRWEFETAPHDHPPPIPSAVSWPSAFEASGPTRW